MAATQIPTSSKPNVTHLLARSRFVFLSASHGLSSSLSFSRNRVDVIAFFWTGGNGSAVIELAFEGALNGRLLLCDGGDHVLDGRDAGERKGVRNVIVVAELALGILGDPTSVMFAAADDRYNVEVDTEPAEVRYGALEGGLDRNGGWGRGSPSAPAALPSWLMRGKRAAPVAERETMRIDSTLPFRPSKSGNESRFPGYAWKGEVYADGGGLCWPLVSYRLVGDQVCSSAWWSTDCALTASCERRLWLRGVFRTEEAATELLGETVVEGGEEEGMSRSESEPFSIDEAGEESSVGRDEARKGGRGGDNGENV